jgi:predicted Zn-dependent peptidase
MLSLESTSARMSSLARQQMYHGRQFTLQEILKGIDAVTVSRVHRMCQDLFRDSAAGLAAVGRLDRLRLPAEGLRL